MEDEKPGDIRVPLLLIIFCLVVSTGGILLVIYVFFPSLSHPWYLDLAILFIASPWIFWFLTYLYTCIKPCFFRAPAPANNPRQSTAGNAPPATGDRQDSARSSVASSKEPKMPLV